jgi:hypothetical protein
MSTTLMQHQSLYSDAVPTVLFDHVGSSARRNTAMDLVRFVALVFAKFHRSYLSNPTLSASNTVLLCLISYLKRTPLKRGSCHLRTLHQTEVFSILQSCLSCAQRQMRTVARWWIWRNFVVTWTHRPFKPFLLFWTFEILWGTLIKLELLPNQRLISAFQSLCRCFFSSTISFWSAFLTLSCFTFSLPIVLGTLCRSTLHCLLLRRAVLSAFKAHLLFNFVPPTFAEPAHLKRRLFFWLSTLSESLIQMQNCFDWKQKITAGNSLLHSDENAVRFRRSSISTYRPQSKF